MSRKAEYELGDLVYLVTDQDQEQRMVTGIMYRPGTVLYLLSGGDKETEHYGIEISKEKDTSIQYGI